MTGKAGQTMDCSRFDEILLAEAESPLSLEDQSVIPSKFQDGSPLTSKVAVAEVLRR